MNHVITRWAAFTLLVLPACATSPTLPSIQQQLVEIQRAIGPVKAQVAYPDIPDVNHIHLPRAAPQELHPSTALSPGLVDPLIEEARRAGAFEDFKPLSDARPRVISPSAHKEIEARAAAVSSARESLRVRIEGEYGFEDELLPAKEAPVPQYSMRTGHPEWDKAFDYTERVLSTIVRRTPATSEGSLLVSPYPVIIAAPGRFHEVYYWDSYFGELELYATHRLDLAQMEVENFLELEREYGLIPNGTRDYYLSRSQPPFLSFMVRNAYETSLSEAKTPAEKRRIRDWLKLRAFPLVERDYERFWMNPQTRFDPATGLNHHWDSLNLPRPERHSFDRDEKLGETYRDVRAEAESGRDFTDAFRGRATKTADVQLNALLYGTEKNLEYFARELGLTLDEKRFADAAKHRKEAMDQFLWNSGRGEYDAYDLQRRDHSEVTTASIFVPLYVHAASRAQAALVRDKLKVLEKAGGIMASELTSSAKQWDGNNGWPPQQVMAIQGLRNYGYDEDAKRLCTKWVEAIASTHHKTGVMYERLDVSTSFYPGADDKKYPTQIGFRWMNSSYVWCLTDVLGYPLEPIR